MTSMTYSKNNYKGIKMVNVHAEGIVNLHTVATIILEYPGCWVGGGLPK